MEANKILQADVLDIIFDGRNKDYGAYNLRKTYDRRLITAFSVMIATVAFLYAGYVIAGSIPQEQSPVITIDDPHISDIEIQVKPEIPKVVPPAIQPPKVEMAQYTAPLIVEDKDVNDKDKPPVTETLEDTKIGLVNQDGVKDEGIIAPPLNDNGKGIIAPPVKDKNDDEPWIVVQIESQYPGGASAWMRYLNKTFRYPEEAQESGTQGTVVVQFIVDKEGNVSDVEALSGPVKGGLREEAVRVIKSSGKWDAAIQNGRKVKSYKKQPIIFRFGTE